MSTRRTQLLCGGTVLCTIMLAHTTDARGGTLSLAPQWTDSSAADEGGSVSETSKVGGRSHPSWVKRLEESTWKGFVTGIDGFDDFVMPVGMFIYFEDPFITSDLRLMYVYHTIPNDSVLRGG